MTSVNEHHYIYSGSLIRTMVDYLINAPQFEPIDILVSQVDRSAVKTMLKFMEETGVIKSFFMDSGAYSVHSQGFDYVSRGRFSTFEEMVDEYIEYANGLDDKLIAIAQFDHIPGEFKKSKSPKDFEESAKLSWENFLYMYPKMKSPEKLIAVFHQGESFDHLKNMLEWKDPDGNRLSYIGISPSNDRSTPERNVYLKEVYDFIAHSSNPNVKTHLFGYTSLDGLTKFPWYSVDSTSHRQRSGYAKVWTRKWGTISMSRTRETKSRGDRMFWEVADEKTRQEFKELVEGYNMTVEQVINDSSARCAMDMLEIQAFLRENPYKPTNVPRQKKLFKIP